MEQEALSKTRKLAAMKKDAFEFYAKVECSLTSQLIERLRQASIDIKSLSKRAGVTFKGEDVFYGSWSAVTEAHELLELMLEFDGNDQLRDIHGGREYCEEMKRESEGGYLSALSTVKEGVDHHLVDSSHTERRLGDKGLNLGTTLPMEILCMNNAVMSNETNRQVQEDQNCKPAEGSSSEHRQGMSRSIHEEDFNISWSGEFPHLPMIQYLLTDKLPNIEFRIEELPDNKMRITCADQHKEKVSNAIAVIAQYKHLKKHDGSKEDCKSEQAKERKLVRDDDVEQNKELSSGISESDRKNNTLQPHASKYEKEITMNEYYWKHIISNDEQFAKKLKELAVKYDVSVMPGEDKLRLSASSDCGLRTVLQYIEDHGGRLLLQKRHVELPTRLSCCVDIHKMKQQYQNLTFVTKQDRIIAVGQLEHVNKFLEEMEISDSRGKVIGESGDKTVGKSGGKRLGESGGKTVQGSRCTGNTPNTSGDKQVQTYSVAAAKSQPETRLHHVSCLTPLLNPCGFLVKQYLHVVIYKTDITKLHVDAIVNAVNERLCHVGGIAKAMNDAVDPSLEMERQRLIKSNRTLSVSENIVTTGGRLPCKHVIHAVGPRWQGEKWNDVFLTQLFDTFINVFKTAGERSFRSLAMSPINAGIYSAPGKEVARIMCEAVMSMTNNMALEEIHLIDINDDSIHLMGTAFLQNEQEKLAQEENLDIIMLDEPETSRIIQKRLNERSVLLHDRVKICVCQKDVTQLNVEAIVCYNDNKLSCRSGLSKEIANTCGKHYKEECRRRAHECKPQTKAITVNTKNLAKIINVLMPTHMHYDTLPKKHEGQYKKLLYKAFHNALEEAQKQDIHRLALSALGSDQNDVRLQWVAEQMCSALIDNIKDGNQLKEVCIFDKNSEILDLIWNELNKRRAVVKKRFDLDDLHSTAVDKTSEANESGSSKPTTEVPAEGSEVDKPVDGSADEEQKLVVYKSDYRRKVIRQQVSQMQATDMQSPKTASTLKEDKEKSTGEPSGAEKNKEEDMCVICLDKLVKPKTLEKCRHVFCTGCIDTYFTRCGPKCPCCGMLYGTYTGNQPCGGYMRVQRNQFFLPGYEKYGTLTITYTIPGGIQSQEHPHPGRHYAGIERTAYLPDSKEGNEILALLKKAFDARLIFTIGRSVTTGADDVITWNDIHHKTARSGGSEGYGYPDPTYLARVRQELAAKGIK